MNLAQGALVALVKTYRLLFSPWVGASCRFEPSCSRYAIEALERHGALAGTALTTWRLLRCHPGCAGGHDPVPENAPWSRRRPSVDALPPASRLFTPLMPSGAEDQAQAAPAASTAPASPTASGLRAASAMSATPPAAPHEQHLLKKSAP